MENFIISLNAVMPLTLYVIIGMMMKQFKVVDDAFLSKWNKVIFTCFFPFIMINNVYKVDFAATINLELVLYTIIGTLAVIGVSCLIVPLFIKEGTSQGAIIQGLFRSNTMLFGLPLVESVYGAGNTGLFTTTLAFAIPVFNIMAVYVLEKYRGGSADFKALLKKICKNPILIGVAIGLVINFLRIPVPAFGAKVISTLSSGATAFAMIVLGASLKLSSLGSNGSRIFITCFMRLIGIPLVTVLIGYFVFGFSGMALFTVLVMMGTPMAASSYTMAREMNSDHELAGQFVAVSTLASTVTIFLWISGLLYLGWI